MAKHEPSQFQNFDNQSQQKSVGDKHQRILDAAVSVFAEKGFHAARVSDIAARAGVADGTVYLYFKSKEEILMSAINTAFDAFVKNARTELASLPSPSEQLRRLIKLHLGALGENRDLAVVFQMELRQSARFLTLFSKQRMVEYFSIVRAAIAEGKQRGLFRPELNEKIATNCFFGAIDEMVTSWVLDEKEYSLAGVADQVANIILKGLEA